MWPTPISLKIIRRISLDFRGICVVSILLHAVVFPVLHILIFWSSTLPFAQVTVLQPQQGLFPTATKSPKCSAEDSNLLICGQNGLLYFCSLFCAAVSLKQLTDTSTKKQRCRFGMSMSVNSKHNILCQFACFLFQIIVIIEVFHSLYKHISVRDLQS